MGRRRQVHRLGGNGGRRANLYRRIAVVAHTKIEHEIRAQPPVVLKEETELRQVRLIPWSAEREVDRLRDVRERICQCLVLKLWILCRQLVSRVAYPAESRLDEVAIHDAAELLVEAERPITQFQDFGAGSTEHVRDVDEW